MGSQQTVNGIPRDGRFPSRRRQVRHTEWTEKIPDEEWAIYHNAIQVLRSTGKPFMLAGAFSLASYTGHWRNTKDLDFYVLPQDREPIVEALTRAGFTDYYETLPYVRHWIYRAWKDGCIVDTIWAMANQRAQVDEGWFEYAPEIVVRGERLQVVPAEELLWCKLYVLQKDRCDWPDILNLVHAMGSELDWEHLMTRLADDVPLMTALLSVYGWLCPGSNLSLPPALRNWTPPKDDPSEPAINRLRVDWLDTRAWFVAASRGN